MDQVPENKTEQTTNKLPGLIPEIVPQREVRTPFKDHPRKQLAADLIAAGLPRKKVAEQVGVSESAIKVWLREDPEFRPAIEELRASLYDTARGQIFSFLPKAVFRVGEQLDSKNPKVVLQAAYEMREFYKAVARLPGERDGNQVNVQINNLIPSQASLDMPEIKPIPQFIEEDLGVPLSSVYPRVVWLLEQIERPEVRQVIMKAGKGAGKSTLAGLFLARMAQKLLTLSRPAEFFGLMPGSMIGILNLSVTHVQAQLAVFREFSRFVAGSPWFSRWAPLEVQSQTINFPRGVKALCGSSSSKGAEGLNWVFGVADEVCHLNEGDSREKVKAEDLVDPVRMTMLNRFPKHYKLLLMSWPTHQKDYIHKEIERAKTAEVVEDLTPAFHAVPLSRSSEEDSLQRAKIAESPFSEFPPEILLTKRGDLIVSVSTWHMKPDADLGALRQEHDLREANFAAAFGAAPMRTGANPFVRSPEFIRQNANHSRFHPVGPDGRFLPDFKGSGGHIYFGHYDVGVKHDAAGIAVGHYENGKCVYDLLWEIKPESVGGEIRVQALRQIFYDMIQRGFTFKLITQDGFEGISGRQDIESHGVESEIFSVDRTRKAYDTWLEAIMAGHLDYYDYEPLYECVVSLVDLGYKVDHSVGGAKDVTDAMAAVAFHVLTYAGQIFGGTTLGHIF